MSATERPRPGVLYASYDGMLEPLGRSQVISYLLPLSADFRIHLISFEKSQDVAKREEVGRLASMLAEHGIAWHPLTYHKRPPLLSTVWDLLRGALKCWRIAGREKLDLFHARSILCGAMLLPARASRRGKLLADIRGFWVDERVDGGIISRGGLVHRVLKPIERQVLSSADHIVTLTEASVPHLRSDPRFGRPTVPIDVIPTCADLSRFIIQQPPARNPFVLGYIGSLGTWYLLDEMLRFFRLVRAESPGAKLSIVNRGEHAMIRERAAALAIEPDALEITSAAHEEMPRQIARMSAGMALIKPCFSKIASGPTKLAEYLGCGVPCVGNEGVGDVGTLLEGDRVGIALRSFDDAAMRAGVRRLIDLCRDEGLQSRCRKVAEMRFSLDTGVAAYRRIYGELTGSAGVDEPMLGNRMPSVEAGA